MNSRPPATTRARGLAIAASVVLVAVVAAACGGGSSNSSNNGVPTGSIATVSGTDVSQQQLDQLLKVTEATYKQQKRAFPKRGTPAYAQLQQSLVQRLVQQAQIDVWAKEQNVNVSSSDVDKSLSQLKQQIAPQLGSTTGKITDAQFTSWLAKQGLTLAYARELLRERVESNKLISKLTSNVHASNTAIQQYYNKNKATYSTPATRHLRHILVQGSKSQADQIYAQVAANPSKFPSLAKKYSKDRTSAVKGGDLGVWRKGQGVPEFDNAAFALKAGAISHPIKTSILGKGKPGFFIIQALGPITPAHTAPLNAALKTQIRSQVESQQKQQVVSQAYNKEKAKLDKQTKYAPDYAPASTSTTTTG